MSKRAWGGAALILLLAAAAVWRFDFDAPVSHARAQLAPSLVPVTPGVVAVSNVPVYLQGIGTVQAYNMVTVKTRVDGPIVKVAFTEGQEVKQGDLLFRIDPRPYEASLEQALAAKAKDQAQLETAQTDLARYASLVGRGFQTRQSYDDQRGLVAQLQASIQGDQAQIDTAKLNLGFTEIRSPIDGRTGARQVDIGNLRAGRRQYPAGDHLPTEADLCQLHAAADVRWTRSASISCRRLLDVTAVSADGKTELATGKLSLIDNTINQATGTHPPEGDLPQRT